MIELNLLPKELRRKEKRQLPCIKVVPIAAGIVGALIALHVVLVIFSFGSSLSFKRSTARWEELRPQKEQTERTAAEVADIEKKMNAVRKIASPPLDWVRMLGGLNEAVIPNVWLFEFKPGASRGARQDKFSGVPKYIEISGYALGKSEVATSHVAKFINSLKKTADFSDYFDEIELEAVNSKVIAGEEAMVFKLTCTVKSFGAQAETKKDVKPGKKKAKPEAKKGGDGL